MRHTLVLCCKALVHVAVHHGIHEEAACIAHNLRVGQLCLTYLDDGLAQLFGSRSCYTLALERMADVAVVEVGSEGAREAVGDMRNEILVFPFVLESALTISILAVGIEQTHHIARSYLYRLHIEYQVLGFGTIRTYVLNGTGSHFARNEREVFGSVPSVCHALSHDIVPCHARAVAYEHVVGIPSASVSHYHSLVAYGRMNHNAFEVAGEKQVAALADDDERHVSMGEDARYLTSLVYCVKLKKATASSLNAERIVRQKAAIEYVLHYIISFISFQCLPLRRKVSSVSRPLAMPRMTNIF